MMVIICHHHNLCHHHNHRSYKCCSVGQWENQAPLTPQFDSHFIDWVSDRPLIWYISINSHLAIRTVRETCCKQTNQTSYIFLIRFVVLLISWLQGHTELSTALDIVPKQAYSETDQIIFFTLHFDNFNWSQSQNNFENYLVGFKYKD